LTSLGWAHPACEQPPGQGVDTSLAARHTGMAGMHGSPGAAGDDSSDAGGHPARHCTSHDQGSAPDSAGCAMVAHCTAAVLADVAAAAEPELLDLSQLAVFASARPLERAHQPESPP